MRQIFASMKTGVNSLYLVLCLLVLALGMAPALADTPNPARASSIMPSAQVDTNPPTIRLSWPQDDTGGSFTIYRRDAYTSVWGPEIDTLPNTASEYIDTNVVPGQMYEYKIFRTIPPFGGYGYICAGIEIPLVDSRGTIILIVDNTYAADLAAELNLLKTDLIGDGWTVIRHDVSPTDTVASVKQLILDDYTADPVNVRSVLLFGHVPVPYSGRIYPDGHTDHLRAWPADMYYGDMDDDLWTDNVFIGADNVAGDGKFDQSVPPSEIELEVGRVDLSSMPAFSLSEKDLLKRYLNKNHNFRMGQLTAQRRGFITDNFFGAGFSQTGFRSFSTFFGAQNVFEFGANTWNTTLRNNSYLWAYGCGPGSYNSAGGVTSTSEIATNNPRAIFSILFGSYFGDWDNSNNLLRAPLASANTLTCLWAGRPNWFLHHMGMGDTIGYSTRLSQSNITFTDYPPLGGYGYIHPALMGDPTLTMWIVKPASRPASRMVTGMGVEISWTASTDTGILGYRVYRSDSPDGQFTALNDTLATGTTYYDPDPDAGDQVYMIRAVKLEVTGSGSFYNASTGVFTTLTVPAATYRPDMQVKNAADTAYVGLNVFNTTGANQTKSQTTAPGVPAVYHLRLNSAGNRGEPMLVTCPELPAGWEARFFDARTGGNDVTDDVLAEGWTTPGAIGPAQDFRVEITPDLTVEPETMLPVLITVTSTKDDTKQDAVLVRTTRLTSHQPDLHIREHSAPDFIGDDIYNNVAAQTASKSAYYGTTVTYDLVIENDGEVTENYTITGPSGGNGWTVRYVKDYGDMADITSLVTGVGWRTGAIAVGDSLPFHAEVTASSSVLGNAVKSLLVRASTSTGGPFDEVKSNTLNSPISKPDAALRTQEGTWVGQGVYNADGTGQTVAQSMLGGQRARYFFQVTNRGNIIEGFSITAPAALANWTVKYCDAAGRDVTQTVTGGLFNTPTLAIGASYSMSVDVTPGQAVGAYEDEELLICATSLSDAARLDAAKAITTRVPNIALPDLTIRSDGGPTVGAGLYGDDGVGQSVTQDAFSDRESVYYITLTNRGNFADRYLLTGPASAGNWRVKYLNAGGQDITGVVTTTGLSVSTLAIGSSYTIRALVTPSPLVAVGSVNNTLISAVSITDGDKCDAVNAVTVKAPISAVALNADPPSRRGVGMPINLIASVTGGSNVEYRFVVTDPDEQDTVVQEYGPAIQRAWIPAMEGRHQVTLWAREVGSADPFNAQAVIYYDVAPAVLSAVSVNAEILADSWWQFTATPTGGVNVLYRFRVLSGSTWTEAQGYSTAGVCRWRPTKAGSFTVRVFAKETRDGRTVEKYGDCAIRVTTVPPPPAKLTAVRLAANPPSPRSLNTPITLTATPVGGTNVEYRFRVYDGKVWTDLQAYSPNKVIVWTPALKKTYTLVVYAHEVGTSLSTQVSTSINFVSQ